MVVHKLIKKSKMQHYHEACTQECWSKFQIDLEPAKKAVPRKSKQTESNFQNPTVGASTFNNFFCNNRGENVHRCETEASDQWI